jgi:hypothetical protein
MARSRRRRDDLSRSAATACMCACHRTPPTATPLACDGLYAATSAEQRGLHDTKLMSLMACHCASGATPPNNRNAGTPALLPRTSTTRDGLAVRATGVRAAETKTLPRVPKLLTLRLGTTQRRSPPAREKSDCAAAAPRERRVFLDERSRWLQCTDPLFGSGHITPQLSGGALRCPARSKRIMKWRACCALATTDHRPLQLLVSRLAQRWLLGGNRDVKWCADTLQLRLLAWT